MSVILATLAAGLTMMLVERLRGARAFPARHGWWPRAILLNLVQAASVLLGAVSWDYWLSGLQWGPAGNSPFAMQVGFGYLVITFVYYWWHRARHEIHWLWRWFHQIHHSPARIEVITSFYKHPLEILANALLSSFLLHVVAGVSVSAAAATALLTGFAELVYHWNIRTPYWLGFIFQRPESHCIHHKAGYHRNNYSDLPLWDMLFGTFENPRYQPEDCGFDPAREYRLADMLAGRDVHARHTRATTETKR